MQCDIPVGLRFSILSRAFRSEMDKRLREKDLTGVQFGVLMELMRLEHHGHGEISQRDLEHANRVTHPTMTEIIKRLEKKGFIRCETNPKDRRHKSIRSTEKVHELDMEIDSANDAVFSLLCQGLSDEQISQFMQITDIMLENAAKSCGKGAENYCDQNSGKKYPRI